MSFFDDPHFVDEILVLVVHDREFLREHLDILDLNDFAPATGGAMEQWYVAGISLEFYQKYQQAVGRYLRTQILDFCKERNLSERAAASLKAYADKLIRMARNPVAAEPVSERYRRFKNEKSMFSAVNEIIGAMKNGTLTVDQWQKITRDAVERVNKNGHNIVDYFAGAEERIQRRKELFSLRLHPRLYIDKLDGFTRGLSFGHLGVIMAPYGRGKSLFCCHLDVAYALQEWNVLHFTLEDKIHDVEDRLDASITRIPLIHLKQYENKFRNNFRYFQRLIRSRIKIVDGTDGGITIAKIEAIFQQERNNGFRADVLVIDYDDGITPSRRNREGKRYEEFADIYRELTQVLARTQTIGWIGSQTGRGTEEMKVIGGKHVADAIGKMREATQVISLGRGEWGEDSTYIWMEKNRIGPPRFGFNIMQNKESLIFYDRDRTVEMESSQAEDQKLMSEADNND